MSGSNLSDASALAAHAPPDGDPPDAARSRRRSRWTLLVLLLACLAPVLASYFAYYVVRPEGRRNFGSTWRICGSGCDESSTTGNPAAFHA